MAAHRVQPLRIEFVPGSSIDPSGDEVGLSCKAAFWHGICLVVSCKRARENRPKRPLIEPIISDLSDTHKRAEQVLVFRGLITGTGRSRAEPNQSIITKKWESLSR